MSEINKKIKTLLQVRGDALILAAAWILSFAIIIA